MTSPLTTQTLMIGLSGSVGAIPSVNKPTDVKIVQQLLIIAGADLTADGKIGPKTLAAIRKYQKLFLQDPDVRVDPGGLTWRNLLAGKLKIEADALVLLPQLGGLGYYSYSPSDRQFGTKGTIQALQDVAMQVHHNAPSYELGIGDISLAKGGHMKPHDSHQKGLNVDIRPMRTDKAHSPVTIADATYSREWTKLLVECLLAHRNVRSILFNDTKIHGVSWYKGHDNHLHVSMKE